jgi:hypothetical protein
MDAINSSEQSAECHLITQCYIPQDRNLHSSCSENQEYMMGVNKVRFGEQRYEGGDTILITVRIFCPMSLGIMNYLMSLFSSIWQTTNHRYVTRHESGSQPTDIYEDRKCSDFKLLFQNEHDTITYTYILSGFYGVTIDGVQIDDFIYWPLTDRNYK